VMMPSVMISLASCRAEDAAVVEDNVDELCTC